MQTMMIKGVECAQVEGNNNVDETWHGIGEHVCSACPLDVEPNCGVPCAMLNGPYVELKYVPILQMRGVVFE